MADGVCLPSQPDAGYGSKQVREALAVHTEEVQANPLQALAHSPDRKTGKPSGHVPFFRRANCLVQLPLSREVSFRLLFCFVSGSINLL